MQLPQMVSLDRDLQLMQTRWRSILNPVLNNPFINGTQLNDISLVSGNNVLNTKLGKAYQGWIITSMRNAFAQIYEVSSTDPTINLTLNASAPTLVDIYVF